MVLPAQTVIQVHWMMKDSFCETPYLHKASISFWLITTHYVTLHLAILTIRLQIRLKAYQGYGQKVAIPYSGGSRLE